MFSTKALNKESRTVAIVLKGDPSKTVLTIWFTERSRDSPPSQDTFREDTAKYFSYSDTEGYQLKNPTKHRIEMTPHSRLSDKFPRFVNYYLAKSNSGKSYNIAQLCAKYLEVFPKNTIVYVSANPLENDTNYTKLGDRILEVDVLKMEASMAHTEFRDCLIIFDDCDAAFSTNMEDLDERLTPDALKELSPTDREKARNMLRKRAGEVPKLVNESIKTMMLCGRKNNISLAIVGHKTNDGVLQMKILGESSGVILFPYSTKRELTRTFLEKKLSFSKADADHLVKLPWYQYDFLYVNSTGSQFIITPDRIKSYF